LYFKEENPAKSRIRISALANGMQINVCSQCQKCVTACPTQALSINASGVVMLNNNLCVGCYACVAACPTQSMFTEITMTKPFKCVACGACAKQCPVQALEITQGELS
jgi:ferredoxin